MERQPIVLNLSEAKEAPGIYIGRKFAGRPASEWANPFRVGDDTPENRRNAVWLYFRMIMDNPLRMRIHELRGQPLLCWCAPKLCHGHALAFILAHQEFHATPCPRCNAPLASRMNWHAEKTWNLLYEQGPCPECAYYRFRHARRDLTIADIEAFADTMK